MTPEILASFFIGFTVGTIFVFIGMLLDRRAGKNKPNKK